MHPERLTMEINLVQNYISDNFHFDHKVLQSNLNFWASLIVPGHMGGYYFELPKVWQVASIGCVLHTYVDIRPSKHLGHPDVARFMSISLGLFLKTPKRSLDRTSLIFFPPSGKCQKLFRPWSLFQLSILSLSQIRLAYSICIYIYIRNYEYIYV